MPFWWLSIFFFKESDYLFHVNNHDTLNIQQLDKIAFKYSQKCGDIRTERNFNIASAMAYALSNEEIKVQLDKGYAIR